jgi:hypothetical protein
MEILLIGLLMLTGLTLGMLGSYLFRVPRGVIVKSGVWPSGSVPV